MGVTATVPIYLELRLAGIHAPPGRAATGGRRHGQRYQGTHRSEEFRRRVRLVASGQLKLRRIDGWRKIAGVLGQHTPVAA